MRFPDFIGTPAPKVEKHTRLNKGRVRRSCHCSSPKFIVLPVPQFYVDGKEMTCKYTFLLTLPRRPNILNATTLMYRHYVGWGFWLRRLLWSFSDHVSQLVGLHSAHAGQEVKPGMLIYLWSIKRKGGVGVVSPLCPGHCISKSASKSWLNEALTWDIVI